MTKVDQLRYEWTDKPCLKGERVCSFVPMRVRFYFYQHFMNSKWNERTVKYYIPTLHGGLLTTYFPRPPACVVPVPCPHWSKPKLQWFIALHHIQPDCPYKSVRNFHFYYLTCATVSVRLNRRRPSRFPRGAVSIVLGNQVFSSCSWLSVARKM